ncbi:hypothetical protein LQZ19_17615 [Treponema primitia]|uniref:hypothetical protein n=1 Tax=Treponema primitia TaxID=88058 RepID=UPI00397F810F
MTKNKRQFNPFDDVLFLLHLASIDWSFGFYERPKTDSLKEQKNGASTNSPDPKHTEKPFSGICLSPEKLTKS